MVHHSQTWMRKVFGVITRQTGCSPVEASGKGHTMARFLIRGGGRKCLEIHLSKKNTSARQGTCVWCDLWLISALDMLTFGRNLIRIRLRIQFIAKSVYTWGICFGRLVYNDKHNKSNIKTNRTSTIKTHLLSIHAVLAGSDTHLVKASSSLTGGLSSLKTLEQTETTETSSSATFSHCHRNTTVYSSTYLPVD